MRASPDDILGMAFFARVVEAQSFSDAARALGVSKSAVSARVARLEARLGVRLLHRTTRRLALTADGVRLYARCARVVAEADQAAELAAGASPVPRGALRVSAPAGFAQAYLTKPLGELVETYPEVRVDLRLGDRIPDLAAEGIDVAVVVARRLADSGLSVRKLATDRVAVCASPAYLRQRGIPFRPQDLVLHTRLSLAKYQSEDWHFHTEEGPVSMSTGAVLVADDARFLREAALDGLGVVMLPAFLVVHDFAAGRLVRVLDDFQDIELGIYALHPHGQLPPASVRAFVDLLAAHFRRPPWAKAARASESARSPESSRSRAAKSKRAGAPMTEQDARRLTAVAKVYAGNDPEAARRLSRQVERAAITLASKMPRSVVTMRSRVRLRDEETGAEREVSLVYPWDARQDGVSVTSELGHALLGARAGGRVKDGARTLTVVGIPYQPEAAGDHHL